MSTTLQNLLEEIRSLEPLPTVSLEVLELAERDGPRDADPLVVALAEPVLRHRMALNFAARAEGVRLTDVIEMLKGRLG